MSGSPSQSADANQRETALRTCGSAKGLGADWRHGRTVGGKLGMCRQELRWRRAPLLLPCPTPFPFARLLTFAEYFSASSRCSRHSVRFQVHQLSMIWHSLTGPKCRVSKEWMGLDAKELTLEEPQASLRNWQQNAVPIAIERLGDDLPIDRNDPSDRAGHGSRAGNRASPRAELRPCRQRRKAVTTATRRLGDDLAADENARCGPPDSAPPTATRWN
jgi:hypothetical protein